MDKTLVYNHIKDINTFVKMPEEACTEIEAVIEKIFADSDFEKKVDGLIAYFFATHDNRRNAPDALAEEKGIEKDLFALVMCELYSIEMKQMYFRREWPIDVYYDSLLDLTIWAKVCYRRCKRWGMQEYGWVALALFGVVVRLGRLQFEIITNNEEILPVTIGSVTINKGSKAINIHIPEGDGITKEKRMDSYKKAYSFFRQTGYAVFTCHSWLLYKDHTKFLPATSNILSFMEDFNLVTCHHGFGDMDRLFGNDWPPKDGDFNNLPTNTGLQKAYVKRFLSGESAGDSLGYFIFDGENIIS